MYAINRTGYVLRNAAGGVVGRVRSKEAAERARRTQARLGSSVEREEKKRETYLIAKFGRLSWVADHPDAGPYQLTWTRLHYVLAEFGSRTPSVGRPMTAAQREAFHHSRAAFVAIEEAFYSEEEFEAQVQTMEAARSIAKLATKFARGEWKKWAHTPSSPSDFATYERDVASKLEAAVSVESLAEKVLNRAGSEDAGARFAERNRSGRIRRLKPTRADVEQTWRRFGHDAVALSDLNQILRESGFAAITEEEAAVLGLSPRRRLSAAGAVRNIVVGLTPEAVAGYWAFADERERDVGDQRLTVADVDEAVRAIADSARASMRSVGIRPDTEEGDAAEPYHVETVLATMNWQRDYDGLGLDRPPSRLDIDRIGRAVVAAYANFRPLSW